MSWYEKLKEIRKYADNSGIQVITSQREFKSHYNTIVINPNYTTERSTAETLALIDIVNNKKHNFVSNIKVRDYNGEITQIPYLCIEKKAIITFKEREKLNNLPFEVISVDIPKEVKEILNKNWCVLEGF